MLKYKWLTFWEAVANLVLTLIVIVFCLPASVPVNVNNVNEIITVGSPWLYILPFALAPVLFCLVPLLSKDNSKDEKVIANYRTRDNVVAVINLIFMCLGWLMTNLAFVGGNVGEVIVTPIMLMIVAPIGVIISTLGIYIYSLLEVESARGICFPWTNNRQVWEKTQQIAGIVGMITGGIVCVGGIFANISMIYLLGYIIMFTAILAMVTIISCMSYSVYKCIVPKKDREPEGDEILEKIEENSQNVEMLDAVIDTQHAIADEKIEDAEKTSEQHITEMSAEQIIDTTNLKDTADYIQEKKQEAKENKKQDKKG